MACGAYEAKPTIPTASNTPATIRTQSIQPTDGTRIPRPSRATSVRDTLSRSLFVLNPTRSHRPNGSIDSSSRLINKTWCNVPAQGGGR